MLICLWVFIVGAMVFDLLCFSIGWLIVLVFSWLLVVVVWVLLLLVVLVVLCLLIAGWFALVLFLV